MGGSTGRATPLPIERRVRAFDPWPGTFTLLEGAMLKVLAAELAEGAGVPGVVLDDRLTVACGSGALRLTGCSWPAAPRCPPRTSCAGIVWGRAPPLEREPTAAGRGQALAVIARSAATKQAPAQ